MEEQKGGGLTSVLTRTSDAEGLGYKAGRRQTRTD